MKNERVHFVMSLICTNFAPDFDAKTSSQTVFLRLRREGVDLYLRTCIHLYYYFLD